MATDSGDDKTRCALSLSLSLSLCVLALPLSLTACLLPRGAGRVSANATTMVSWQALAPARGLSTVLSTPRLQ